MSSVIRQPKTGDSIVFVKGISGLANNLYQIATALYYVRYYDCALILDKNSIKLAIGSSTYDDRDTRYRRNNVPLTYFDTIFNRISVGQVPTNLPNITDISYIPKPGDQFVISGFCQNYKFLTSSFDLLFDYLNLADPIIHEAVKQKYSINPSEVNVMVGLRIGFDYKHMTKVKASSYARALQKLSEFYPPQTKLNIFVIADVKKDWEKMIPTNPQYNIIFVDEDDITQIYVGLECNNFILSESTYHYWIALLAWLRNSTNKVVYFTNTLLSKIGTPNEWISMNY